jgi:hypothetical protein
MDGGHAGNAGAFSGAPPWMADMPETQEHFPARRHGWRTCRKRRSIFRRAAMDGGHAGNAGAFSGAPPWIADMPETQGAFSGAALALFVTLAETPQVYAIAKIRAVVCLRRSA